MQMSNHREFESTVIGHDIYPLWDFPDTLKSDWKFKDYQVAIDPVKKTGIVLLTNFTYHQLSLLYFFEICMAG